MNNKHSSTGKRAAEGLGGLAAIAAAAAAAYYFYGKDGKKHRRQAAGVAAKAKAEMVKKIRAIKNLSQKTYDQAAKEVLAKYRQAKDIKPEELKALGQELKTHWTVIAKELKGLGKKKVPTKKKTAAKKRKK